MIQKKLAKKQKDKTVEMTLKHTLDIIGRYGIEGVTTKRISHRIKMSTGILHHHFGTKENIIYAAYVYFIEDIRQQALLALKNSNNGYDCLKKFGFMHFSDVQTSHVAANIWLSFWHCSIEDKRMTKLLNIYYTRFISNVTHLFKRLNISQDNDWAKQAAYDYLVLIQGAWLALVVTRTLADRQKVVIWLEAKLSDIIKQQENKKNESTR